MRLPLLAVLAALVLLAGCGGDDEEGGGGEVAAGTAVAEGKGYKVELPDGWSDDTDVAEEAEFPIRFDRLLRKNPSDGFATNVNVIRERAEGVELDDVAKQSEMQLRGFGAREISPIREAEVDQEDAIERDYSLSQGGRDLRGRQLVVRRDRLYTITLTALEDAFEGDLAEFEEILDSWRWD